MTDEASPQLSRDISLEQAGDLVGRSQEPTGKPTPDFLRFVSLERVGELVGDAQKPVANLVPLPHKQEETRSKLAAKLVNLSIGTVIGVFALIVYDKTLVAFNKKTDSQASKELITLIWTSQVALVGTALGFYFGNQKSGRSDD